MKSLVFKHVIKEPKETDILSYPDYLVGWLLREGIGCIEADRKFQKDETVEFVLTPRATSSSRVIGHLGTGYFRSFLAHFGYRCHEEMLYGGQESFSCEFEREGKIRTHRFSLFLCNEPTMGCWMRLYLYGIDGIFSLVEKAAV